MADPEDDYFQPLSVRRYYGRAYEIYQANLEAFLGFTMTAAVFPLLSYHRLHLEDETAVYFFKFVLIPAANLIAEGAAIVAVAMAYANAKPDWKVCLHQARNAFIWLWLLQLFKSLGGVLLAPLGVFTFSTQILLLEQGSGMMSSLKKSFSMVFSSACSNLGAVLFLGCILCPLLGNIMNIVCRVLVGQPEEDMKEYRQQIQQLLLLPLTTCVWTTFYLDIRIRKGLTRQQLQSDLGLVTVENATGKPGKGKKTSPY